MVANGTAGLSVWSLKDPAKPVEIGQVTLDHLKNGSKADPRSDQDRADHPGRRRLTQFWEGENMTVDSRRKLAFMSRDSGPKGQIIIDLKDPWNPQLLNFSKNYQGHTSTCLNDCRFMWSVGSVERGGPAQTKPSPVSVTDMRDPLHPFVYPAIFGADVFRAGTGRARRTPSTWTSTASRGFPAGGVRGYWTEGLHKDPTTGKDRFATPYDPISYGAAASPARRTRSCTTRIACRRRSTAGRRTRC